MRGGADKSLARPTSRCPRTESIVSLERGVCSCAELFVFACYNGWKEACQATRAISTTWRRELSKRFFFLPQSKAPKEIHAILREKIGEHAPSYTTVKNCVAQFKRGDFSTCDVPRPGRPKTVTTPEIIDQKFTTTCSLDWKNNWKVAIFRPTRSLLPRRPGWTGKLLDFFFFLWLVKVRATG